MNDKEMEFNEGEGMRGKEVKEMKGEKRKKKRSY